MTDKKKERATVKEYFQFNELLNYFFRKKNTDEKPDFSLRSMHFVNKFSMIVFLIAVIYLVIKHMF